MKTWQKVAIGVGIFLVVSCIIITAIGGIGAYYTYKNGKGFIEGFTSPEAKLKKAKEICDFTLPAGYDITFAMDLMGMKMAMINYTSTQQMIILMELPRESQISNKEFKSELEKGSKEELLKKINNGNSNSKVKEIKEIGSLTINGHTIPYCKAVFENNNGKLSDGIIANCECTEGGKNFLIMSMTEDGKYDENITDNFLKNLKCH
jgi:hypothetical protein